MLYSVLGGENREPAALTVSGPNRSSWVMQTAYTYHYLSWFYVKHGKTMSASRSSSRPLIEAIVDFRPIPRHCCLPTYRITVPK